ncbi:ATP-binding protein [Pseudofrankia saprophytica]|uniref:ATP-binding protein n=1 Tax=Pseudofrankia saprophytica TaxID=298655 RepID=UPI000234B779|nr:ATP-binding protein [Pseudofrankia saprophytica]
MANGLILRPVEIADGLRWRWLLVDGATGNPIADHPVELGASRGQWEFAAFTGLHDYLHANTAPDQRVASATRIVGEVGEWAAAHALGPTISKVIADQAPVTVTVEVPERLRFLPDWPWEIAHVAGRPLAAHNATFDYLLDAPAGMPPAPAWAASKAPVGEKLRVLAVFSQPSGTSPLALRRERRALVDLIRTLAGRGGYRIELRVLQYGVTREKLRATVEEADGWDLLHLSCHGTVDTLALERTDGRLDRISTVDLIEMLRPSRRRMKLAVLSACQSAAADAAQILRWLGLDDQAEKVERNATPEATAATAAGPDRADSGNGSGAGLARGLVDALGCAVLAMRYPVGDEFAIRLTDRFYDLLLDKGRTLDTATGLAVVHAAGPAPTAAIPPPCAVTPVLLGPAEGLRLAAPTGAVDLGTVSTRTAWLPAEPARFVGRVAVMTRASAALAPRSGQSGVLFHGMAGAGKTACAVELAHQHADNFAKVVFWSASDTPDDYLQGLPSFAAALETQLDVPIADKAATADRLAAYLPTLADLCARVGVLFVLDNLETLLGEDGHWRDPRWPALLGALTRRGGQSRVVLTSRIRPAGLDPAIRVEPVNALPLAEAALLARELPGLRALLHADDHDPGAERESTLATAASPAEVEEDRALLVRALRVVQGHPKLLELADAAARAGRDVFAARVTLAEQATTADGRALDAFFGSGESAVGAGGFLAALAGWVEIAVAALSDPARLFLQVVCCLEEDDRQLWIIESAWAEIWSKLGRSGDPPAVEGLTRELAVGALAVLAVDPQTPDTSASATNGRNGGFGVHPGVAEVVRAAATSGVRQAVDEELADLWHAGVDVGRGREGTAEQGELVVRAGVAAAPYLLRLAEFDRAAFLLEEAYRRTGRNPGVAGRVLPLLARVAEATGAPRALGMYGRVLSRVDPVGAEGVLRAALAAATSAGDDRGASAAAGELTNLLWGQGRLREALAMARDTAAHTAAGGLGAWTQATDEGQVLQIRGLLGDAAGVLAEPVMISV